MMKNAYINQQLKGRLRLYALRGAYLLVIPAELDVALFDSVHVGESSISLRAKDNKMRFELNNKVASLLKKQSAIDSVNPNVLLVTTNDKPELASMDEVRALPYVNDESLTVSDDKRITPTQCGDNK